jgi:hypothetical protein
VQTQSSTIFLTTLNLPSNGAVVSFIGELVYLLEAESGQLCLMSLLEQDDCRTLYHILSVTRLMLMLPKADSLYLNDTTKQKSHVTEATCRSQARVSFSHV